MKFNKIIFPALACTLMLGSCDDNKWNGEHLMVTVKSVNPKCPLH